MTLRYLFTALLTGLLWALVAGGSAFAQQTGTLTGTVTDTQGQPLAGANVVLAGTEKGTAASADGSYRITNIPAGDYTVRVSFVGYQAVEREVTIEGGSTRTQNFQLEIASLQGEEVMVTVGSRARNVAAEDMAVPVDVYGTEELQLAGAFETGRILQQIAPSVNFPQNTLSDGMDALRSFTMRGLSPDQTLVLINGKRRHKTALVNRLGSGVQGGSSPIDLNSIPANAIKRMEVLRDGASSQYGSDAIAGVVNMQLKNEPLDPTVETRFGGYVTDPYPNDGTMYSVRPSFGVELGDEGGFVNFFGEYRLRTPTNRAGPSGSNPDFGFSWPSCCSPTPSDEVADTDGDGFYEVVKKNRVVDQPNFHWGDGRSENLLFWANGAYPVANYDAEQPTEVYAFGGYSYRKGKGQGFYRDEFSGDNWTNIYPKGFLPNFENPINDYSISAGLRGMFGEWNYDFNVQRGLNDFQYNITNSLNASYGPYASGNQTEFYAGTVRLAQSHVQLDVDRTYEVDALASPLNVAAGAVFRGDTYQIESGEEISWAGFEDAPWQISQTGGVPAAGAQVFPGFRPSQEVDETRTNLGTYVDLEANVLDPLLINVAGRFENYSDFGGTFNWKVASRLDATDWLSLRGTAQTGFRAPNQAQKFFSKVSTTFINNRPVQTGLFPVNSDVGNAFGIPDLQEETSFNLSGGIIFQPIQQFQVSADYFNIQIDDRIILSEDLGGEKIRQILRDANTGAATASFFSNAIDTRTQGVDITSKYALLVSDGVQLQFRGAFNWTDTKLTGGPRNPRRLGEEFSEQIFPPVNRRALTQGSAPNTTTKLTARLATESVNVTLRGSRYGEQLVADEDGFPDEYTMGPEYIFGAEVGYSPLEGDEVNLAVGVDNIFDVYPDRTPEVNDPFDVILPYPRNSPFGFNGRFIYSRLTISL